MRLNRNTMVFCKLLRVAAIALACGSADLLFAQDLRPISATLAARIATSGRKTIAVVDFTDLEGDATRLGRFLAEEVSVDLVAEAKGFDVIDRTHLKAILQEHRLSATGLIDPQTARKLGLIAGADALLTGTMTPLGDSIRLDLKVLDTQSAKMLTAASTDIPKTPAIASLLSEQTLSSSSTPSSSSHDGRPTDNVLATQAEVTAEESRFLFAVRKCQRSGKVLTCTGYVKNKSEKRRTINISFGGPTIVDDLGNQYSARYDRVRLGSGGTVQELEPDLPVNFSIEIEDADPAANKASLILSCYLPDQGGFKVALKDVRIVPK